MTSTKIWGKRARNSTDVVQLPFNAWMVVAQNLVPIPVEYIRLATVSRMFYRIFMSDELWRRVSVYGVEQDIAEHYLSQVYLSYVNDLDKKMDIYEFSSGKLQPYNIFSKLLLFWLNENLYDYFTAALFPDAAKYIDFRYAKLATGPLADRIMAETGDLSFIKGKSPPLKQHVLSAIFWGAELGSFREYQDDRDVVKLAVQLSSSSLIYASESLKNDEEIVLSAVSNYPCTLRWASERLQATPIVVLAAVSRRGSAIQHAPKFHDIKTEGAEAIIRAAIRQDPSSIHWLETATQGHPVVVEETFNNTATVQGVNRVLRRKLWSETWEEGPRVQRPKFDEPREPRSAASMTSKKEK